MGAAGRNQPAAVDRYRRRKSRTPWVTSSSVSSSVSGSAPWKDRWATGGRHEQDEVTGRAAGVLDVEEPPLGDLRQAPGQRLLGALRPGAAPHLQHVGGQPGDLRVELPHQGEVLGELGERPLPGPAEGDEVGLQVGTGAQPAFRDVRQRGGDGRGAVQDDRQEQPLPVRVVLQQGALGDTGLRGRRCPAAPGCTLRGRTPAARRARWPGSPRPGRAGARGAGRRVWSYVAPGRSSGPLGPCFRTVGRRDGGPGGRRRTGRSVVGPARWSAVRRVRWPVVGPAWSAVRRVRLVVRPARWSVVRPARWRDDRSIVRPMWPAVRLAVDAPCAVPRGLALGAPSRAPRG